MLAPLAVSVVDPPVQMLVVPEMVTLRLLLNVVTMDSVSVQPLASVTVTV